jgi:translation initiation factor 2B subunit (eIF-2B alpha/beta/delta family)
MGGMKPYDWRNEVNSLADDVTSGSQAICLKAAEIVVKTIDAMDERESTDDRYAFIKFLSRDLERVKPAMAGIYNLAAALIEALETAKSTGGDPSTLARKAASEYRTRLLSSNNTIAQNALALLPNRACVATLSRSGTVEAALLLAREKGKLRRVLMSEGRPAYEGRLAAAAYAGAKVPLSFVADAALPAMVGQCDMVIVGGDALSPSGLVNKAGTFPLALAARQGKRPVAVCIGVEKIIPFDIPEHHLREDPSGLWEDAPITAHVINRIFEYTPLELIDHVVTEEGVTSGDKIPEIFASIPINPYLPDWL